ncbi:hypothetical protein O3M35_002716 [Rhynocoris fuscipes]|uniref:Cuticle protein n=1 Tax=Rhynocoris fuscipes TaxID=488301 RepID=A0AAW1CT20_9HEMI
MRRLILFTFASLLSTISCKPQYISTLGTTYARPLAYAPAQYAIAHAPFATIAHAPIATVAHAPVATIAHAPIATVAHAPVATIAHAPVATIAHAPVTTIARPTAIAVTTNAEENDPHPQYSFSYNVNDPTTGDVKSQSESRDGDNVQGTYSLVEPDGATRTVDYTADPVNGFNALVHRDGAAHPQPSPAQIAVTARPIALASRPIAALAPAQIATIAHAPIATIAHAPIATIAHAPITATAAPLAIAHAPIATYTQAAPTLSIIR